MTESWSIVVPEATTNLCTNPSFELDETGWTAGGGMWSQTRSDDPPTRFGYYKLTLMAADATALSTATSYAITFSSAGTYTVTAYVCILFGGMSYVEIDIANFTGSTSTKVKTLTYSSDTRYRWIRLETEVTVVAGDLTGNIVINATTTGTTNFLLDGVQIEAKTYPTTYCDGDQENCYWNGAVHASTSTRDATKVRTAGKEVNLSTYNITIEEGGSGWGMPPLAIHSRSSALRPGSTYTGWRTKERVLTMLIGFLDTTSYSNLHAQRSALIDVIKPDAMGTPQPFRLVYSGSDSIDPIYIDCVYDAGLEFNKPEAYKEQAAVRLIAHDPYYYEQYTYSESLNTVDSVANANYIIRKEDGDWKALGTGLGGGVAPYAYSMALDLAGNVYVGGSFNTGNAVNLYNIGKWNGSTFVAMGAGPGMNDAVLAVVVDSSGIVYIGGVFTDVHGAAANNYLRIASWDGSVWTEVGNGVDNAVRALAFDQTSYLYVGGDFLNVNGGATAANRIARWDGTAWSALGVGTNGPVYALTVGPDGTLYVGGNFTTAGGVTVNYVAKWTSDGSWGALGAGMGGGSVYGLSIGPDGRLYAVGTFTTADGASAPYAAVWNGSYWSPMSSGLAGGSGAYTCKFDNHGILWVGGDFTSAGGLSLADYLALWNGTMWVHADANLPGTPYVYDIVWNKLGNRQYIAFSTAGTGAGAALTTVNNVGTTKVNPKFIINRDGGTSSIVESIRNETTGATIWLNYSLKDDETLTIDCEARTVTSTFYGNVTGRALLRPADLAGFELIPGNNSLSVFVNNTGATVSAFVMYRPRYWSLDK